MAFILLNRNRSISLIQSFVPTATPTLIKTRMLQRSLDLTITLHATVHEVVEQHLREEGVHEECGHQSDAFAMRFVWGAGFRA